MATFRPYGIENGVDTHAVTTLNGIDLKGRLAGDVLQEMMYAGPEGEIHPGLYRGCDPYKVVSVDDDKVRVFAINKPLKTIDESKIRQQMKRNVLGADPKHVAKVDMRRDRPTHPVHDNYAAAGGGLREAGVAGPAAAANVRYPGANSIIPHVTSCACKDILSRAALKYGEHYTTHYSRFIRDFHSLDQRYFNDTDIIVQEFFGMPNASTLAILLSRAGVIEPPPFPLRVCAGRREPCACSVLGPEMVKRIYFFLLDDWEHAAVDRLDPLQRNIGNVLSKFNLRVATFFDAQDYTRRLKQYQEQRVLDMAGLRGGRGGDTGAAGTWDYDPLRAREPGRGRLTLLVGEDGGVTENKRRLAQKIAARYGYVVNADGSVEPEVSHQ
jgi:hypothetical protein